MVKINIQTEINRAYTGDLLINDGFYFINLLNGFHQPLTDDYIISRYGSYKKSGILMHQYSWGKNCLSNFLRKNGCHLFPNTVETGTVCFVYDYTYFIFELPEIGTILVRTKPLEDPTQKIKILTNLFSGYDFEIDGIVGENNYIRIFYKSNLH